MSKREQKNTRIPVSQSRSNDEPTGGQLRRRESQSHLSRAGSATSSVKVFENSEIELPKGKKGKDAKEAKIPELLGKGYQGPLDIGPKPCYTRCPTCRTLMMTRVNHTPTIATHCAACILCCCFFCIWPVCFAPYFLGCCKDADHYCSSCGKFIGHCDAFSGVPFMQYFRRKSNSKIK